MSEADAMWGMEMCELGAEEQLPEPTHEVVTGKRQDRIFIGSRRACWAFRRSNGGFVRPYSGDVDWSEYD